MYLPKWPPRMRPPSTPWRIPRQSQASRAETTWIVASPSIAAWRPPTSTAKALVGQDRPRCLLTIQEMGACPAFHRLFRCAAYQVNARARKFLPILPSSPLGTVAPSPFPTAAPTRSTRLSTAGARYRPERRGAADRRGYSTPLDFRASTRLASSTWPQRRSSEATRSGSKGAASDRTRMASSSKRASLSRLAITT